MNINVSCIGFSYDSRTEKLHDGRHPFNKVTVTAFGLMGCAQSSRPSMESPPPRLENRYAKGGSVGLRRSKQESRNGNGNRVANRRRSLGSRMDVRKSGEGDGELGKKDKGMEMVDGWPKWLIDNIPGEVLKDIVPKSSASYVKIDKIGQGTYSNVYKARDRETGKVVALKKILFDTSEPESVKFMAREIMILRKLDHPNIVKLEGLATSKMQCSLYLVFDYMPSDLSRMLSRRLTEPQIKCYMQQLLSGLEHCHERGILHRDIKGSNLLIDRNGMLKIADFGLASLFDPKKRRPLTNQVVTLWYRAPELLLGSTDYGLGIDLWSAGCLLAEMFAGRPILPGRTEIEQVHRIFKLCGTPPDDFYRRLKLSADLKPPKTYKSNLREVFKNFPSSSLGLLSTLLAMDPDHRGSSNTALHNEFFQVSPLACELTSLPLIQVEKEDEVPIIDKRRHRSRRRSQSQKERRKKKPDDEKPKEESPPRLFSSPAVPNHEPSSRTEAHLYAEINIVNRPRLPAAAAAKIRMINYNKDDVINRLDLVQRSASNREVRSLKLRNLRQL